MLTIFSVWSANLMRSLNTQIHKHAYWGQAQSHLSKLAFAIIAIISILTIGERRARRKLGSTLPNDTEATIIAIVVPFTQHDLQKVVAAVDRWSRLGDPCPGHVAGISSLNVLFWFNRDLAREPWTTFAQVAESSLTNALRPVRHCVSSIMFDSAKLSDTEDPYPFGASNMWYKLYVSEGDRDPLKAYDYFLWAEQDLMPVKTGWMDALVTEVATHRPFFMRGSIYRGINLDKAVKDPKKANWVTHINGNALYTCKDVTFRAMVKSCYYARTSEGVHASFDLAIWMGFVSGYMHTWKSYQHYAHMFQYTAFMQNYGYGLPAGALAQILEAEPSTFMIHGDAESAGEQFKKSKASQQRPAAPVVERCTRANCSST